MIKLGMERIFTQGRIWLKQAYFKIEEIPATEFTSEPGSQPTTPDEDSLYLYAKQSASSDVSALWYKDDLGNEHEIGGASSFAPANADYLVKTANASLSAERVVTDTATVTWDWSTPGQAKANVVGSVGGSAWSVLTNGDAIAPALVFDSNGDVVMTEICNGAMC